MQRESRPYCLSQTAPVASVFFPGTETTVTSAGSRHRLAMSPYRECLSEEENPHRLAA